MGVPDRAWATPMTPFSGVRISWLMLARNSDLARLAASAASRADARISASRFSSVMSLTRVTTPPSAVRRSWTFSQRSSDVFCSMAQDRRLRAVIRSSSHSASRPSASG